MEGPCRLILQLKPEMIGIGFDVKVVSYSLVYDTGSRTVSESLQSTTCTAGPPGSQNKHLHFKGKQVTFNILSPIADPGTGAQLPISPATHFILPNRSLGSRSFPCSGWEARQGPLKANDCYGGFLSAGEMEYVSHPWCLLRARTPRLPHVFRGDIIIVTAVANISAHLL